MVSMATLPALLGELWIMLWLLFKGVKVQRLAAPAFQPADLPRIGPNT
jgi:hypothetical protein